MEKLVNKILKVLKDHVNQNNREIQYNQDEINRLLSEGNSAVRKNELDYKYALNKELLDENDHFINMQLQLTEFMEKYSHLFPEDEMDNIKEINEEDEILPYFNKTITGQIKFGPHHPQFNNPSFFNELMKYYQEKENYEMCDHLIKVRSKGRTV